LHIDFIKLHVKELPLKMWAEICETIILTKFRGLTKGRTPPKWPPKNETFELLNIES